MTTELSIINQQYNAFDPDDMDNLLKSNESLEIEVKKLRKDKAHLIEQLTLIKTFSDSLWDRLKANHCL